MQEITKEKLHLMIPNFCIYHSGHQSCLFRSWFWSLKRQVSRG